MEREPRFVAVKVASQRKTRSLCFQDFGFVAAKRVFIAVKCFTAANGVFAAANQ